MDKIDLRDIYKPVPYTGEITCDLKFLPSMLEHDNMDMSPPYQRPSRWSKAQQAAFMGHLLSGGEVLPIIVQRVPDSGEGEMLDGKQRVEAMLAWLNGEVGALLPDGRTVTVDQLEGHLGRVNFRVKYVNLPFEERKRFYVAFNSAGERHTAADLEHALKAQPKPRK